MIPKSLSASAAESFDGCPARFHAEYILRIRDGGTAAASLGTAVHNALEAFVVDGHAVDPSAKMKHLLDAFDREYMALFSTDMSRKEEGVAMLKQWYRRTHPIEHEIISTEVKDSFPIKVTHDGETFEIPFNYIWDRCDRLSDGEIEVVDYKTISVPLSAEQMRSKIQVRSYALAAMVQFGEQQRIWVTYDMLRHGSPTGVSFKRDDCIDTYRFLQDTLRKILAESEDEPTETLNDKCKWCVRKQGCDTLRRSHNLVGGINALDIEHLAERRKKMAYAKAGLEAAIEEADGLLLAHLKENELLEMQAGDTLVKADARSRRVVDSDAVRRIVGPEIWEDYGGVQIYMKQLDALLEDERLTNDQRALVKQQIRRNFSAPSIKTE